MSERLERWKARERVRSAIGWLAVWMGVLAVFGAETSIWRAFEAASASAKGPPALVALAVSLACSLALLACAVGLWRVRRWARWATVVLLVPLALGHSLELVLERSFCTLLPFELFALVYLLLPATGRRFARAREAREVGSPSVGTPS